MAVGVTLGVSVGVLVGVFVGVCVGVFVEPGDRGPGLPIWGGDTNRNVEYDTLSDAYAQFLLDELLPRLPVAVTDDPTCRAICAPLRPWKGRSLGPSTAGAAKRRNTPRRAKIKSFCFMG